ncbi:erythromycin esterase family protein [Actinokineospora bangkokensis]|uniref:Erythromycin esterase n=1 Tax=Actinokineospora bangkokensis TaxID=1193682 RepID=A0A1Q9LH26_9PSEU|nr:erythromycin esterase family protein [Actinokineospora bangkokensis]OLR91315.1 hypothetical protein BJP25_26995 [Actinokineospora bangkokensis]
MLITSAAVHPLATVDPDAPLDDLTWLDEVVEGARVVGIGEGAHYTREFLLLRHRVLRYLVSRHGFTAFAMESGFTEGWRVNQWVHGGPGDLDDLLATAITSLMGIWAPVRAQLEWMRSAGVPFYGIDLSGSNGSVVSCLDALAAVGVEVDPALRATAVSISATSSFTALESFQAYTSLPQSERDAFTAALADLVRAVRECRESIVERFDEHLYERTTRTAELAVRIDSVVRRSAEQDLAASLRERDAGMAENVAWVLDREPRVVLAGHNVHLQHWPAALMGADPAPPLGQDLANRFGDEYRVIGTTSGTGRTLSTGEDFYAGPLFSDLPPPPPGTVDAVLDDLSEGPIAVVTSRLTEDEKATIRAAGEQRLGPDTLPIDAVAAFDALVHVPTVSAAPADPGALTRSPSEVRAAFAR